VLADALAVAGFNGANRDASMPPTTLGAGHLGQQT